MKFIDTISITVKAGRGGDGVVSFKTAKGKPRLGPDGGDGGTGGDVVVKAESGINTLSSLRYKAEYCSEDGVRGGPNGCRGRCGEDLVIPLPIGTVIRDELTGEVVGELLERGQTIIVAKGGRHGLGNTHWATSTHQTPEESRPGGPGEERELTLDLKLIADVGLAGFPNAGKSTLLSRLSAAKPKIADYPFTTLTPQLGVVDVETGPFGVESFVIADIPGLIEGASEGKGLGLQFLKHLERTSLVAYIIDIDDLTKTPMESYMILREELRKYSVHMSGKHSVIVLNKIDCCDQEYLSLVTDSFKSLLMSEEFPDTDADHTQSVPREILAVSGLTGTGLKDLAWHLSKVVKEIKSQSTDELIETETFQDTPMAPLSPLVLPWELT